LKQIGGGVDLFDDVLSEGISGIEAGGIGTVRGHTQKGDFSCGGTTVGAANGGSETDTSRVTTSGTTPIDVALTLAE